MDPVRGQIVAWMFDLNVEVTEVKTWLEPRTGNWRVIVNLELPASSMAPVTEVHADGSAKD